MLQYAAQGACMALEDAVVIGESLKEVQSKEVPYLLNEYNRLRGDRTARVVEAARFMGNKIYHATGDSATKRNAQLNAMTPDDIHQTLQWLHGMRPKFFGEIPGNKSGIFLNNPLTENQVA